MTAEPSLYDLIDARRDWLQREEQKLQEQLGAVQTELLELTTAQSVAQRLVSQRQAVDTAMSNHGNRAAKPKPRKVKARTVEHHTDPAIVARVVDKTNELAAAAQPEPEAEEAVQPGTVIVPQYEDGQDVANLPRLYQRIIDALTEATEPLRAADVAQALGKDTEARAEVEGLRTKLNRLADRGWIAKLQGGKFTPKN